MIHINDEEKRLNALKRYEILDTDSEPEFDNIVQQASLICDTPIALISFVDEKRQWFKAKVGLETCETARGISVCQYAIQQSDITIIPDTHLDQRFVENPLVTEAPYMRFYAGYPLITLQGCRIGTVCVLDTKPRNLDVKQQKFLKLLAQQTVQLLEQRLLLKEKQIDSERIELALNSGTIVGTWVWDVTHNHFIADERFARTFSLNAEQLRRGTTLEQVVISIHPDDLEQVQQLISQTIEKGGAYKAHYRVLQHDKSWLWIEANGRVEKNEPNLVRFPGVLIDIHERKLIELELKEQQERYHTLFKSINQGFCVIQMIFDKTNQPIDYMFLETNPAFNIHTGLENAIGKTMLYFAPDHEKYWFELYGNVALTGQAVAYTNYAQNLSRWYDVYAFPIGELGENKVGVLFNDITEKKIAELTLKEREYHLNLMIESVKDFAIISLDLNGMILSWNTGAQRIFGATAEERIGQSICVIFTREDQEMGAAEQELNHAKEFGRATDERWHQRANGERFYASGIMAAMFNDEHQLIGFTKIARDNTVQFQAREQLLEARNAAEAANLAKTEFLANMSHEIRTPMNAIIGLSTLLSKSQPLSQKQSDYIKTLQLSADSLLVLINDLLDISKIEARTVELEYIPFSIKQLMQEVISMMTSRAQEKGLAFTIEDECVQQRMFMGDPTRLRQIVLNLCSNAIKFTERGGVHITITCHPIADSESEIICIAIKDTGIGINTDKLTTIFEKFVQADTSINRKYGGTGLGLAITKTLTEIMGGTIQVESEIDKGSTFTVCIPFKAATSKEIATTNLSLSLMIKNSQIKQLKGTLLIVEDYEPNILVAQTVLEDLGYKVNVATNGFEAFEKFKNQEYEAILMDVQMHGMNGFEATKLIREHEQKNNLSQIPIIGMTAHALTGDKERCLGVGMTDYISKPFNVNELASLLEKVV